MPTYEFRCPDGHEFEKFYRTISGAESESVCPICGKVAGRFMSAAGFAFKGSGFYLTDYGKNAHRGEAPPNASSGESAAKESSSESAKSESASSGGESKPAPGGDGAKSSESSAAPKPEKKAEPKAESKPAKAPPKPSSSE